MKKISFLFFLIMLSNREIHSEVLPSISFGGGVIYSKNCNDIPDDRACDSSNLFGNIEGESVTRDGSKFLINQAVSTQPFTSMFRTFISSGSLSIPIFIGVSGNTIYYSTRNQEDISSLSVLYSSLTTPNQIFSFAVANNDIYMTGNALTDQIFRWEVNIASFHPAFLVTSATFTPNFFAKYLLWERGYMLYANLRDVKDGLTGSATYYDDRLAYSLINNPSSTTVTRVLNFNIGDGEYITGMTKKFGRVNLQKLSSIMELTWTDVGGLNPSGEGGDQSISQIASGFGHISDYPPESIEDFDVLFSKSGILLFDGGRRARDTLGAERIIISQDIRPLIDTIIKNKKFKNVVFKYYPKLQQIVMSYEHPDRFPKDRQNSVIVYDLLLNKWYPVKNWHASSFVVFDGFKDDGSLAYGSSMDGYIYMADQETESDDERTEISIDSLDKNLGWSSSTITSDQVIEGTASMKMATFSSGIRFSSTSRLGVFNFSEWHDKSKADKDNSKISFKVFPTSISNIENIRIDLLVEHTETHFSVNFSSVIISSSALINGNTRWSTVEILLSSFPIKNEWISLSSESFPSAKTSIFYGLRFASTVTGDATLYIDDIRLVRSGKTPLNPFYFSKRFNFGSMADKELRQIILTRDIQRDSSYSVDFFTGIKNLKQTKEQKAKIPKKFYICNYNGVNGLSEFDLKNMEFVKSTVSAVNIFLDYMNGTSDDKYIYTAAQTSQELTRFDRHSISSPTLKYGSIGTGTSNFLMIHDMSVDKEERGNLYVLDNGNHRLQVHNKTDLQFKFRYGTLGNNSTSFHSPTGIDHDSSKVYIGNEGNQNILAFANNFSSFTLQWEAKIDADVVSDLSVKVDEEFLYAAYNKPNDNYSYFQDIVLEQRSKGDGSLINRTIIRPKDSIAYSTYTLNPPIALIGNYVLISFTDDLALNNNVYTQKRLKDGFKIIDETVTKRSQFGIIADGLAREPIGNSDTIDVEVLPDPFMQFKFYAKGNDNKIKFRNFSTVVKPKIYRE